MLGGVSWLNEERPLWNVLDKIDPQWVCHTKNFSYEFIKDAGELARLHGLKFVEFENVAFLRQLFPDCKIIGVWRDPKDAYCSFRTLQEQWGDKSPLSAEDWCHSFLKNFASWEACDYIVNYEELVTSFQNEMAKVFCSLEVPNHSINLQETRWVFEEYSAQKMENSTKLDASGITSQRIGRYKKELSKKDIQMMDDFISHLKPQALIPQHWLES